MGFEQLIATYIAAGCTPDAAREEAAREIRMTTGDIYFGRSDEELDEMHRQENELYAAAARTAGVCEEFPNGEFAVAGFNC